MHEVGLYKKITSLKTRDGCYFY